MRAASFDEVSAALAAPLLVPDFCWAAPDLRERDAAAAVAAERKSRLFKFPPVLQNGYVCSAAEANLGIYAIPMPPVTP
jgi:hypothetical protein